MTKPCLVIAFDELDQRSVALVGGKGAHLGELSRLDRIRVPEGFCVTTQGFRHVMSTEPSLAALLDRLARLAADDGEAIRAITAELRQTVEAIAIPDELSDAIARAYARLGERAACAVRSSATAEDSATASFAGQHDSYLNVSGLAAILQHVRRCWASLFTERAVTYRIRNGVDHRRVEMAVVVQRLVAAEAAGILFTADPVTGNRKVASVEASFGLGEALVSGLVNADTYQVRDGAILARAIGSKRLAVYAALDGATRQHEIDAALQSQPVLGDAQVLQLVELGRHIEAHFGSPQDIEWCLAGDGFHIVQSRPITTLFPIPAASDLANRVYVSVGHQQMMTDAMRPLGLSMWQLKAARPMSEAGGRLFVDVTKALASPAGRQGLLNSLGRSDPLIGDALQTIIARGDFLASQPDATAAGTPSTAAAPPLLEADPAIVAELIGRSQAAVAALTRDIQGKAGTELLDFIRSDIEELKRFLFDATGMQVIMAAISAAWRLDEHLETWLGVQHAADTLTQSVPNNVTSEMGLALLDVADVIRPHPDVVRALERADREDFIDELPRLSGGREARDALRTWLARYGVRGVGEIDITRPRFAERPTLLLPMLLGNVRNFAHGEAERRFEQGRRNAAQLEHELLERLRGLPDGSRKADEAKRMIDRVRTFAGYREYPKYAWVSHDFVYKQALLAEAERLVHAGVLRDPEAIYFLRYEELTEVVRTRRVNEQLVREREHAFRAYQRLHPPRVLTSEGEAVTGTYRRDDVPAGVLVGLPVSAGVVEGRARVIRDIADADLEPDDVLVTVYTDPSWTPLFVAIKGLVTEVGGLMTHGAVIAREYGLPAVVGAEHATTRIKDGQRIRVDGTTGYVEVLA
ncbi:MAG: phosphoenolpyruvate synthase [Polyangiaceae bacterium]|nr:phosphoenolpyruvate synthase [Polyangiaceae bacterium]